MKKRVLATVAACLAVFGTSETALAQGEPPPAPPLPSWPMQKPINEQATADAWTAFRSGDYSNAISKAEQCISRFRDAADRIQAILESNKTEFPKGQVPAAEKQRIANYQILHDVATCFLIKGWSEEKLEHKDEAKKAYAETKKYTRARAANPNEESFWSPAEVASNRLEKMAKQQLNL
jgi:hypothetical protein